MTDTKIFVSKDVHGLSGVTASYNDPNSSFLKVVAVRTWSTQQDGIMTFTDGAEIEYSSEVTGTIYRGNVSSITPGIKNSLLERVYVLEVSNIFGDPNSPTLLTDTYHNLVNTDQPFYTTNHYFTADMLPRTFEIDTSVYTGPTNTVQLNFYRLLKDENQDFNKYGDPISFVR